LCESYLGIQRAPEVDDAEDEEEQQRQQQRELYRCGTAVTGRTAARPASHGYRLISQRC
jgi:hypothetical protein